MMGEVVRQIINLVVKVGFWASIIFTFVPLLTLIISGVLIALDGSVITDLYYMLQIWLPFNLNVILLWTFALVLAFSIYWLAVKVYTLLLLLLKD